MTAILASRLTIVRTVTFGYVAGWIVVRSAYLRDLTDMPDRRFEPIGVLTALGSAPAPSIVAAWSGVTLVAAVVAASGRCLRAAAPVAALGVLGIATFTSSFGQVFHTEHLLVLHVLVLAAHVALADPGDAPWADRWTVAGLQAVTAVTYVVAGVTKLRMSGLDWVTGDVLRSWVATDNLRKLLLDDPHSPLGGALAATRWIWPPAAVLTLAVELGAPLAVVGAWARDTGRAPRGGWVATGWALTAWTFHLGVLALMAISFPYQLTGVAYLALLPVERLEARWRPVAARRAQLSDAPG